MSTLNRRLLIFNSASGVGERFIGLAVQVWLYQHLIKRISPEEYSLLPVIMAIFIFVPPLTALLTAGLARFTVEAVAQEDDQRVTEITSTMLPILVAAGLGLTLLGVALAVHIGSVVNIIPERLAEAQLMLMLLFTSVALRLVLSPFGVGLYVRQMFVLTNALTVAQSMIRLVLLVVLMLAAGPKVLWVVVAMVIADLANVLVTTVYSLRVLPSLKFRRSHIRWSLVRPLTGFGAWNMVGWFAYLVRSSSDILILNRLGTPQNVNSFHLALLPDNQIESTLQRAYAPLQPPMIAAHAKGEQDVLQQIYTRGGRYCLWAALFAAMPLIVFRHEIWSLYLGPVFEMYSDVPLVMTLLLLRFVVEAPIHLTSLVAHAANQVRPLSLLGTAAAFSKVLLVMWLVGGLGLGAIGAAFGALMAALFWSLGFIWGFGLRLVGLTFWPWFRGAIWRGVLPSITAGVFGVAVRTFLRPEGVFELLAAAAAFCVVYVLTILLFCMEEDERAYLTRMLGKLRSHVRALASAAVK